MPLGHRFPIRARVVRHQVRGPAPEAPKLRELNRERLDRMLSGRDGGRARRLLTFLEGMKLADGGALLAHVKMDGWLEADRETRQDVFSLINNRIVHLRERNGMAPFDDPVPPGRDNVFIRLRELLEL